MSDLAEPCRIGRAPISMISRGRCQLMRPAPSLLGSLLGLPDFSINLLQQITIKVHTDLYQFADLRAHSLYIWSYHSVISACLLYENKKFI